MLWKPIGLASFQWNYIYKSGRQVIVSWLLLYTTGPGICVQGHAVTWNGEIPISTGLSEDYQIANYTDLNSVPHSTVERKISWGCVDLGSPPYHGLSTQWSQKHRDWGEDTEKGKMSIRGSVRPRDWRHELSSSATTTVDNYGPQLSNLPKYKIFSIENDKLMRWQIC